MSRTDYAWSSATPPRPDVYTTRRNESKYLTLRYWDGACWYEIGYTNSRGGTPFAWPKNSITRQPKRSHWSGTRPPWVIRKIGTNLSNIQWGEPFKVYDEKEVLAYLVTSGVLRFDWKTAYQSDMRVRAALIKGGA